MANSAGPDARARKLAARQDGVINRSQLRACGLSETQIAWRVKHGLLIRLYGGVYLVAGSALTLRGRVRAGLFACGTGAVASHATAAALWGIALDPLGDVDVTVHGRDPRPRGVRVHRVSRPLNGEIRIRDGLHCTSPARTICDMAATKPRNEVEYALQEAAVRRLVRDGELEAAAARSAGRRGAQTIREILDVEAGPGFTRSQAERMLLRLINRAKLPPPEKNVRIEGHLVDAVWRDARVVVEIDGFTTHGTRVAFAADRARDAALQAAGWRVLRFTYAQLRNEPDVVIARIAQALDSR